MIYAIIGVIALVVGTVIGRTPHRKDKSTGTIFMDMSTGDPLLFLELHVPIESVMKSKTVRFDVDTRE